MVLNWIDTIEVILNDQRNILLIADCFLYMYVDMKCPREKKKI